MNEFHFAMVSEWMVNGNLNEFLKANPDADRVELVRFRLKSLSSLEAHQSLGVPFS